MIRLKEEYDKYKEKNLELEEENNVLKKILLWKWTK